MSKILKEDAIPDIDHFHTVYSKWELGDWFGLMASCPDDLHAYSRRVELALFFAIAHFQTENLEVGAKLIKTAQEWGATELLIRKVIVAGVYNSLGRFAAAGDMREQAVQYFEKALSIIPEMASLPKRKINVAKHLKYLSLPGFDFSRDSINLLSIEPFYLNRDGAISSKDNFNFSSSAYWEERYGEGRTSGAGSYGVLSEFKAAVINKFIRDESIDALIEFGCGDGAQLSKFVVDRYVGVDSSPTVIKKCQVHFSEDSSKLFFINPEFIRAGIKFELTISLDVIYHLVEDDEFEDYMSMLFGSSMKYCIVYSCDDCEEEPRVPHIRRRKFTDWVKVNAPQWRLFAVRYNDYPFAELKSSKNSSISDFFFFKKIF